jgi:uncharacterized membrane protein
MQDRWMKSLCILYLSLCIFLCSFRSPVYAQDFTINRFHSDITIKKDSSFTVIETTDVEFHESKHGIYREIPFRYTDNRWKIMKTPIKVLSVTNQSGEKWKFRVRKSGNIINIRIGDPDKYVEGHQTYVITYTVENAILFLNDHDELYWNVTGNLWPATIKEASADVVLKVNDKSHKLLTACYTGGYGSTESACNSETYENGAEFFTKKSLGFNEGLTIALGWDKGLVSPPSSWKVFLWAINISENWIFLLPILSFIFMLNLWNKRGRDPKVREAITVRYEPPQYGGKPLIPAEVGTLIDEKLDSRDITSTIVGLAVKGYIKIEETKTEGIIFNAVDYYLSKEKEPDDNLSPFEKLLMSKIFTPDLPIPGRMVSDLKNKFYTELDLLRTTLYGELVSKKYFLNSPEKVRRLYLSVGIAVIVFSCIILTIGASSGAKSIFAGILMGLPILAFAKVMPAKTRYGASAYMDVLGFQEFMKRAEKDKLERIKDKDLFSKFLPYAIALDVVDNWAKAFEGIYQEQPQWYVSQGGFRTFSPYSFSRSISSATSSMSSAMFSAPRSSGVGGGGGFSGGGSSGGGFGGGGGGSW